MLEEVEMLHLFTVTIMILVSTNDFLNIMWNKPPLLLNIACCFIFGVAMNRHATILWVDDKDKDA